MHGWEDSVSCLAKYSEAVSERRNQEKLKFIEINTEEAETIGLKAAFLLAFIKSNNIDKNNKNLADIISKKISFMKISEIEESIAKLERLNLIKPGTSNNLYKLKLPSGNSHGASMITKNWTPSENVYEVLSMGNIKKEFIDSKLPEFRLYWMEKKNVAKDDWNHKFVNFVKQEWVKNQSYNNGELYQIDFDWEPSKDVYEILKMAGIKKFYAITFKGFCTILEREWSCIKVMEYKIC